MLSVNADQLVPLVMFLLYFVKNDLMTGILRNQLILFSSFLNVSLFEVLWSSFFSMSTAACKSPLTMSSLSTGFEISDSLLASETGSLVPDSI